MARYFWLLLVSLLLVSLCLTIVGFQATNIAIDHERLSTRKHLITEASGVTACQVLGNELASTHTERNYREYRLKRIAYTLVLQMRGKRYCTNAILAGDYERTHNCFDYQDQSASDLHFCLFGQYIISEDGPSPT